ncbi:sodium:proton antiporter [Acidobacteria bacterium Mor1]|nr:sodium:proton antiporter [Acidobacteria bacterium Mor1]
MSLLDIASVLIVITAIFAYANHRYLKLPTAIGVMLIALLFSMGLIGLGYLGFGTEVLAERLLERIDFDETLLHGMLGFLLFAGALHINLEDLWKEKFVIGILATVGVVLSAGLVGAAMYFILEWLGIGLPWIYCLLFGALISPTDPIAVLGIMKSAGAPKSLETKISGESLFNDGVGVVLFLVLLEMVGGGHGGESGGSHALDAVGIARFFLVEAVGGAIVGLGLGYGCYWLLRTVDNFSVEVLLSLALVMGGYSLSYALHTSGPIAMVVAGLFIGNHGRRLAMSDRTREHLDIFWLLLDEILNAVLFVLIGLELLLVPREPSYLLAGLIAIPVVLAARFVSVGGTVQLLRLRQEFSNRAVRIMVWGGLRGGISVALALSLPAGPERGVLLALAYAVVVFSILVQGLTIGGMVRRSLASGKAVA